MEPNTGGTVSKLERCQSLTLVDCVILSLGEVHFALARLEEHVPAANVHNAAFERALPLVFRALHLCSGIATQSLMLHACMRKLQPAGSTCSIHRALKPINCLLAAVVSQLTLHRHDQL